MHEPRLQGFPLTKSDLTIDGTKCPNQQPKRPTLNWRQGTILQGEQQITWQRLVTVLLFVLIGASWICHLSSRGPCRMSRATLVLSLSPCPVFLPSCHRYCPERAPQEISCKQISISQSVSQVIQSKTDGKAWDFPKGESNYLQKRTCTDTKRHFSISSDSVKWYYFLFEIRILFLLKGELSNNLEK